MPAVQDMRAAHPQAQIDWVVETPLRAAGAPLRRRRHRHRLRAAALAPVAAGRADRPGVARLPRRPAPQLLRRRDRPAGPDQVGRWSSRAAWLTVGGKRYAMANQTDGSSYEAPTRWVADVAIRIEPRVHAVTRARELCARALGYPVPADAALRLAGHPARSRARGRCGPLRRPGPRHLARRQVLARIALDRTGPRAHRAGLRMSACRTATTPSASAASGWPRRLGQRRPRLAAAGPGPPHRSPGRLRRRDRRGQRLEPHRRGAGSAACADLQLRHGLAHRSAGRSKPAAPRQLAVFAEPTPDFEAVWQAWQRVAPR